MGLPAWGDRLGPLTIKLALDDNRDARFPRWARGACLARSFVALAAMMRHTK